MSVFNKYTVVINPIPADVQEIHPDWCYSAHLAEIPEAALTAFGSTHAEAIDALVTDFLGLEELAEKTGKRLPPPRQPSEVPAYPGRITLRMPPHLHQRLAEIAETEGLSLNSLIVQTLKEAIGAKEMNVQLTEQIKDVLLQVLKPESVFDTFRQTRMRRETPWNISPKRGGVDTSESFGQEVYDFVQHPIRSSAESVYGGN